MLSSSFYLQSPRLGTVAENPTQLEGIDGAANGVPRTEPGVNTMHAPLLTTIRNERGLRVRLREHPKTNRNEIGLSVRDNAVDQST